MLNFVYAALICVFFLVYVWSFYNLPILIAGVRHFRRSKRKSEKSVEESLPTFSIVVPVKNEERVIGRLLDALVKLRYPADKKEIIIVEDGSTDGTLDACLKYAREPGLNVRVLHRSSSNGKPSALNYGIKNARGQIVGVFDADSVPANDVLLSASGYFADSEVAAVQGRTLSINSEENMLTKFISYEEAVWCETYLRGKDVLDLFVHLKGSCQFIRRDVLEKVAGFDEKVLSEDMEVSARLTEKGYRIRYAPDVRCWQETPGDLKQLFKQRTRWFRGTMEVAFKYGRLIAKLSRKNLDAEATLFGPFVLIASLLTYFAAFCTFFTTFPFDIMWQFLVRFMAVITTVTVLVCGLALVYASKPRRLANLLWLPFIYFYWSLQTLIALYAVLLILLRRPRRWVKTEKKGVVRNSAMNVGGVISHG
ncbi:MAG: glycosyltransferase family 2 protein [Candidatus Bathyarchaeota archaeon]|nr:glycosyltransferase family 2 protein [Candidatus Bathyarchaeota archaeon]MDH5787192.1 glycosyltransferase family 2 protein [Candidatus Bathyarchaeota archaeon]